MTKQSNKPSLKRKKREASIAVYHVNGNYLSNCSRLRAEQMVAREKARWIGEDTLELLIDKRMAKEIRKKVLIRDGYTCYICDKTVKAPVVGKSEDDDLTYDHVVPRAQGGSDLEDNLAVCCADCNKDKADLNPEQYVVYKYIQAYLLLGGYKIE